MTLQNIESPTRRDRLNILVEILNITKKGAPKTRIMYQANMSFAGINDYLPYLLRNHLLVQTLHGTKTIYRCTEKGLAVLNLYGQLNELMTEPGEFNRQVKSPPLYIMAQH